MRDFVSMYASAGVTVLLYNVVFGLHAEVTVVRTTVCEIDP